MEIGFDGVIAAAGGYVEFGGQVLVHQNVPIDQTRRVIEWFDARGIDYFLGPWRSTRLAGEEEVYCVRLRTAYASVGV